MQGAACTSMPNFVKLGKRLLRYRDFSIFKMAAVRYLGFVVRIFRPPTKSTRWSLSLCKTWLEGCIVLNICEFQFYARLDGKCLFTPLFRVFWGKNGGKRKLGVFLSLYAEA